MSRKLGNHNTLGGEGITQISRYLESDVGGIWGLWLEWREQGNAGK
jgi:hypothetical protein